MDEATGLTLFVQDSEEELDDESSNEELDRSSGLLELRDVIGGPLSTLSAMLEVLLPRIKPNPDIKRVSMEDQQSFASVVIGELANQFPILHQEIDDPFLSEECNQELHKQMSINVCRNIEELYVSYLNKATTIQEGILSREAHMSHLRAALAVEAHQRLNIPRIRAEILDNIRGPIVQGPIVDRYCGRTRKPPVPKHSIAVQPKQSLKSERKGDYNQIESGDTQMDTSTVNLSKMNFKMMKAFTAYKNLPIRVDLPVKVEEEMMEEAEEEEIMDELDEEETVETVKDASKKKSNEGVRVRKVSSLPNLWEDFILCDLKIINKDDRPEDLKKEELMEIKRPPSVQDVRMKDWNLVEKNIPLGQHTKQDLSEDLGDLMKEKGYSKSDPIAEDEIYPLLQAQVMGLSKARRARLQAYETSVRMKEESRLRQDQVATTSSVMDTIESIPSVPTLEQLPYLNFEHVSGGTQSSNLSLHVKSGLPVTEPREKEGQESGVTSGATSHRLADSSSSRQSSYSRSVTTYDLAASHDMLPPSLSPSQRHSELSLSFRPSSLGSREPVAMSPSLQTPRTPLIRSPTPAVNHVGIPEPIDPEEKREVKHSDYPSMTTVGFSSGPFPSFPVSGQRSPSEVARSRPGSKGGLRAQTEPVPGQYEPVQGDTVPEVSKAQLQPDVVSAEIPGQGPVRTAHVRVSKRVPLMELRLKPYGPIYNELEPKWDSTMTEDLDSTLHEGKEVTAVYKEIMNILPGDHLQLDTEPTLEPSLKKEVKLSNIFASNSLHHRRSRRVVNKDLHKSIPCPWTALDMSKKKWEGIDGKDEGANSSDLTGKSVINTQDYLKFVSRGETDYLRLVYHLYDSQGSDSEDEEEERKKQEKIASLRAKLRERDERRAQRYKDKSRFINGRWNVNTVTMGGLGGDIGESSDEEDEDSLRKLNEKAGTMEIVESNLKLIWKRLHMPELEQIDMAIKYSNNISTTKLNKVLNLWEQVCNYIEEREEALLNLATFEKSASDPSRLLTRGPRGSASIRLEEAKQRDKLHSKLNRLDLKTSQIIKKLHSIYGDTVTYKGRVYSEKMRLDRTEMLYHLQQIRRQEILQPAIQSLALPPELQVSVHP